MIIRLLRSKLCRKSPMVKPFESIFASNFCIVLSRHGWRLPTLIPTKNKGRNREDLKRLTKYHLCYINEMFI